MTSRSKFLAIAFGALAVTACDDAVGPEIDEWRSRFVQLAAGDFHTCGLRSDGAVFCWGFNDTGALGVPADESPAAPVRVTLPDDATSVVARGRATCALLESDAWCWGSLPGGSSAPVQVGNGIAWQSVTPAHKYARAYLCGVSLDGAAYCWGAGGPHLGLGPDGGYRSEPVLLAHDDWTMIAANQASSDNGLGDDITCGATAAGAGYCWGFVPEIGTFDAPEQVWPELTWKSLQPGFRVPLLQGFVCGIADSAQVHSDRVYCWGEMGVVNMGAAPQSMGFDAQHLSVGGTHACSIARPWLTCWGDNFHGQLGTGDREPSVQGQRIEESRDWIDVATGIEHTCGLTADGDVYCWGSGYRNQMGDGRPVEQLAPIRVAFEPE